ncbi:MAG: low specificity L-threonine aldolase [Acidobacteria bacterium]|nr:MAG: low specificity L-threonine aldolase [Acidobacteriota bacterium]
MATQKGPGEATRTPIDLRSDTVTRPTPAMRRAMAEAEVGDDVFREDPTVRRLEELAARMLGKEAALFVPSGTMGNQVAVNVWTRPGQEVILEERSHIFNYEMGTMAAFSGVLPRPLRGPEGALDEGTVRAAIRPQVYYLTQTGLITLENTHNMAGGTIFPQDQAEAIGRLARERGIPIHLDGARIFNASVALAVEAASLARPFGSVMTCLSKGLGAPVGSVVAGPGDFIQDALRVRKRLGGGMRQAGVLAAAGLVALRDNVERLAEDHANARLLAERVAGIEGLRIDPRGVQTNIVIFTVEVDGFTAHDLAGRWKEEGVLALALDDARVRAVTHYDVDRRQVVSACDSLGRIVAGVRRAGREKGTGP